MSGSSQWKFRKLYSTPKWVVKMKLNKLLVAWIIIPIHARRGRSLGIFSFSLVPDKKLSFFPNIYLFSLLLAQFSPGKSSSIESQIKDLLTIESIKTYNVYASDNQINKLVSNWDEVRKTKVKHAQKFWLVLSRETWKKSLSIFCSWSDDLPNCPWVVFVTFCKYASYL